MTFSLAELFSDLPEINVVDIGASSTDGPPPYQRLIDAGKARVVGFEPSPEEFRALQSRAKPHETYLPYAIGDGHDGTLNVCSCAGMTSLLELDMDVLKHFHAFAEMGIIRREKMATRRLDDVAEVKSIDYLKLDVQGSELAILQGGTRKLQQALVVHTEVQFIPFYKGQPLFAELDQELLRSGFYLHRFAPLVSRAFKPLVINNDIHAELNQLLWADAVYVHKFTDFARLPAASLLKIAFILHEIYGSFDLAGLALEHCDRQQNSQRQATYLRRVTQQK